MEWLETGLAFAVTMMIFSSIVSVIIETGHRMLRTREKGLQMIMKALYKDVLWPRLSNQLTDKNASFEDFIKRLTWTRFLPDEKKASGLLAFIYKIPIIGKFTSIHRIVNARELKSLTTLEFIERLPETEAGRGLIAEAQKRGKKYLEIFLKDLASKYEDFGESATDYFSRRSRLVSVIVSICLAFALNINAIYLVKTFLENKEIRQTMVEQGNEVAKKLEEQGKAIEGFMKIGGEGDRANLEKIKENMQEINNTVKTMSSAGIPIGWDTAIWKKPVWQENKREKSDGLRYARYAWLLFLWAGSVLLTGLLIGLGGPFWFNTFRKLSALSDIIRGFQTPVQKEKEAEKLTRTKPEKEPEKQPKVVEIFEVAAKACALSDIRGRALLTPEGNIDQGGTS